MEKKKEIESYAICVGFSFSFTCPIWTEADDRTNRMIMNDERVVLLRSPSEF